MENQNNFNISELEELTDEVKKLRGQNAALKTKINNLSVGLGGKFYTDRNRLVTFKYGKEIQAYLSIRYAAIKRAEDENKGKRGAYPFLYRTNAKMLAELFGIKYNQAQKTIKFLTDSGAWRLVEIEPGKIYVYQLGERKRVVYQNNGKWEKRYVSSFYFTLYKNTKSLSFYKQEREQLSGEHKEKKYEKKYRAKESQTITKLVARLEKNLDNLYKNDWDMRNKRWDALMEFHGMETGYDTYALKKAIEEVVFDIKERNREKYG